MKFGYNVNKIILDVLEANIDRLPEQEVDIFQEVEQELINKNLNDNGTDWKTLRKHYKQSLIFHVFKRNYRIPELVYEKLTYPHLIKLFRIDITYYRGVTAYTQQQLVHHRNMMLYDLKPNRYSADIYSSFKSFKGNSVKINVDDPGFATIIQEDLKLFLVKKTAHEKERKESRAKNKRKKPPEPKATDWIEGNVAQKPVTTVVGEEDYIIEDDEEVKELNEQELVEQELANMNVEHWLTLLSQELQSPTNQIGSPVSGLNNQENETTFIETTSNEELIVKVAATRSSGNMSDATNRRDPSLPMEKIVITPSTLLQKLIVIGLRSTSEEFELYYGKYPEYQKAVEEINRIKGISVENQVSMEKNQEVRSQATLKDLPAVEYSSPNSPELLQKLINIGIREEFELYYSNFSEYHSAVEAIRRLKGSSAENMSDVEIISGSESTGAAEVNIQADKQNETEIQSESCGGAASEAERSTSRNLRIHPLEFVEPQPTKLHEEIKEWLENTEPADAMQKDYLNDPLSSFSKEADSALLEETNNVSDGSLVIDGGLDALTKTMDPNMTCHIIGDNESGDEECGALSQRAFKKKLNIPRRQILRLKKKI